MQLIVNTRKWKGTASELNTSNEIYELGDEIFLIGDTSRFKVADGKKALSALPWTDTSVKNHTPTAANVTATLTVAQIAAGVTTSTSAAAVALTLPSAAALLAELKAARGTWIDWAVDNSAGANTVTVTPSATITAATAVITGGATLTVATGAVGLFRIYFVSATAAKIYRLG